MRSVKLRPADCDNGGDVIHDAVLHRSHAIFINRRVVLGIFGVVAVGVVLGSYQQVARLICHSQRKAVNSFRRVVNTVHMDHYRIACTAIGKALRSRFAVLRNSQHSLTGGAILAVIQVGVGQGKVHVESTLVIDALTVGIAEHAGIHCRQLRRSGIQHKGCCHCHFAIGNSGLSLIFAQGCVGQLIARLISHGEGRGVAGVVCVAANFQGNALRIRCIQSHILAIVGAGRSINHTVSVVVQFPDRVSNRKVAVIVDGIIITIVVAVSGSNFLQHRGRLIQHKAEGQATHHSTIHRRKLVRDVACIIRSGNSDRHRAVVQVCNFLSRKGQRALGRIGFGGQRLLQLFIHICVGDDAHAVGTAISQSVILKGNCKAAVVGTVVIAAVPVLLHGARHSGGYLDGGIVKVQGNGFGSTIAAEINRSNFQHIAAV